MHFIAKTENTTAQYTRYIIKIIQKFFQCTKLNKNI